MKINIQADPYEFFLNTPPQERTAVVCGNGPSLRGFDFKRELKGYDVFGMNAAYRHWDRIGWYPNYYSCLDNMVAKTHERAIARLIERREEYGIRAFFLRGYAIRSLGELGALPCVLNMDTWRLRFDSVFYSPSSENIFVRFGSTGSNTLVWAVFLGYKNIILLGIDGFTVQVLPESRMIDNIIGTVVETPQHNPNYFFDDYQQKGDHYGIPNADTPLGIDIHKEGWGVIHEPIKQIGIVVVNANPQSNVDCFPKCPFTQSKYMIETLRKELDSRVSAPGYSGIYTPDDNIFLDECKILQLLLQEKGGTMIHTNISDDAILTPFMNKQYSLDTFAPIINADYLQAACSQTPVSVPDCLIIDSSGKGLTVLCEFPFDFMKPQYILCPFNNQKTRAHGYAMHDIAELLQIHGYCILISEWHPQCKKDSQRHWRRLAPWPIDCQPFATGWLLAFKDKSDAAQFKNMVLTILHKENSCS